MKILLVKPSGSVCEECCCGGTAERSLPVQIVHAAAVLRREGLDVTLNDLQVQPALAPGEYDTVVTWVSVFDTLLADMRLVDQAKAAGATTVVVLNDPTGLERALMERFRSVDYVVRLQERERTLTRLVKALDGRGSVLEAIPGLLVRRPGGGILDTGEQPAEGKDLAFLGDTAPVLSELPLAQYTLHTVLTGKGCPFACAFCQYRKTPVRKRRVQDVLAELSLLARHGVRHVTLQDINFVSDLDWARQMLAALASARLGLRYSIDCRLEALLNTELLGLLKKARVVHTTIGVETLQPESHAVVHKSVPLDRLDEALRNCHRHGVMPHLSFMIGFPGDTAGTLAAIERRVRRSPFALFSVGFVVPPYGSALHEEYRRRGLMAAEGLEDYVNGVTGRPVVRTERLSPEDLIAARNRLMRYAGSLPYKLRYAAARRFRGNLGRFLMGLGRPGVMRFERRM